MLRKFHYLNYVLFASGILLYLLSKNGTGFQYLWGNYPEINPFAGPIGLYLGISAMLFFVINFLDLDKKSKRIKDFLIFAFILRSGIFVFQLCNPNDFKWEVLDLIYIQIALIAGILQYRKSPQTAKWYIIAYILLDISFLVSGSEHIGLLPSSICTVYSIYIGIILQFIFLSIGIGETVQETYRLKNDAQAKLIIEYKKTDELKEKINRELEKLVKERTQKLSDQYIEIQVQQEEIKSMNENLEELVKRRTNQLVARNKKIEEYSFSNSHLVRGPLARILGLTYLARLENNIDFTQLKLIEDNAKELDEIIKKMTRILEETESTVY
ncbi:MAG: hypothetical protein H7329_11275 [Opitutaceae bacterium]|nr:hypothetical protein [Cytophagales bacterium]